MSKDLSQYVTTKQASEMMGVDTSHVRNLLLRKKVKGIKLGHDWLVYLPSVEQYRPPKSSGGRPRSGNLKSES